MTGMGANRTGRGPANGLSDELVSEPVPICFDPPGCRVREVNWQQERARARHLAEKFAAGGDALRGIPVEDREPVGLAALECMVKMVARDHGALPCRADVDASGTA